MLYARYSVGSATWMTPAVVRVAPCNVVESEWVKHWHVCSQPIVHIGRLIASMRQLADHCHNVANWQAVSPLVYIRAFVQNGPMQGRSVKAE